MKTTIVLFAAALGAAALAQSNNPSSPLSPEHKKLEIWLGVWTYETVAQASPLGPAGTYIGGNTTRPILGGKFVEFRGEDKGPTGTTQWTETDGYNPATQRYTWRGFASDGSFNDVSYTIEGTKVIHAGTVCAGGKTYQIRGTVDFTPDFASNVEHREISVDGKTWQPLWVCRATKLKAALALPDNNAEQELLKLEDGWNNAMLKANTAFLDRIFADDLTDTDSEGTVWTKAQDLSDLKSGDFKCTAVTSVDRKVRVLGDTAIVTGVSTIKAQYKGADKSGQYQWTDTWVKRDGDWVCVATHGSKLAPK